MIEGVMLEPGEVLSQAPQHTGPHRSGAYEPVCACFLE
jgi:hypothetical protein